LLVTDKNPFNIQTISEIHLDKIFFNDTVEPIHDFRRYRNANGGGVSIYVQSHIPVKIREDHMLNNVAVIWLQVHLPHLKPSPLKMTEDDSG
jgi:hypothetical protein